MKVYRAPMRPRDRHEPATAFGLAHDLVGIGDDPDSERTARFAAAEDGAYVWTRAEDGFYHLGRIAGPARRADGALNVVRPAQWLEAPFGADDVPAGVAATFARGGRNFQRIHDDHTERRTAELWEAAWSS